MATKASDLFIECLEEEGCEYIFGIPGEENLDFLDSLSRSKKIKLVLTRHEQGAGFMASVYGRLTGKTGVWKSRLIHPCSKPLFVSILIAGLISGPQYPQGRLRSEPSCRALKTDDLLL